MQVPDAMSGASLLEVLRDVVGIRSAKDGCAPQGQCGCCTVLVDGRARVACVTAVRRVAGRSVETLEGLADERSLWWADRFIANGATQCGFCTPGIIMRLEDRTRRDAGASRDPRRESDKLLAAHLCRCTGWQGITETALDVLSGDPAELDEPGDPRPAGERAQLEGGVAQVIDRAVVSSGMACFAADSTPADFLVAVPDDSGGWVVRESLTAARDAAGRTQGRRSTVVPEPPIEVPAGDWAATLSTSWVEPAYLETDATWCEPGGEPASPVANGGAFGGKEPSPLGEVARRLADEHGRTVLVRWSREDVVRHGPKRPPLSVGVRSDGTGVVRVAATTGIGNLIATAAPGVEVEQVDLPGPPTTTAMRAAGWAEVFCALVAAGCDSPLGGRDGDGVRVELADGAWARTEVIERGAVRGGACLEVSVGAGEPLDPVVLRSYVIGAAHMAAGMVCSEALAVDGEGTVHDLTIRSFGILAASQMPEVRVVLDPLGCTGEPRAVSEAVFTSVAATVWAHHGFGPAWPLRTTSVL